MAITSAIVLFAVIWFLVMFVTLPIRLRTQGDDGEVVPGTQAGAPVNFNVKRTMLIVTVISLGIWALVAGVIVFGGLTVHDLDWFGRMGGS